MGVDFLGQFLVRRGYISNEQLVDALAEQDHARLTALAVSKGILLPDEVRNLQELYGRNLFKLGDRAVQCGMMTQAQLDYLRRLQASDWRQLGVTLVRKGVLNQEELDKAVADFNEAQACYALKPKALPEHMFGRADVVAYLDLTAVLFNETLAITPRLGAPEAFSGDPRRQQIVAGVTFRGDYNGRLILGVELELADAFGRRIMGVGIPQATTSELLDAVGEFCNCVVGGASAALARLGHELQLGLPCYLDATAACEPIQRGIRCPIATDLGSGEILVE